MKINQKNLEVLVLFVLSLIQWPGPTVFKISCPRENARIVRKIIQSKWLPVLEKYKVSLPLECPFHPSRDIFGPQQAAKHQHRPSQWTCGFCGKSFFEEKYLDMHFDSRHKSNINMAEDAVCLADYCDIMRCDVLIDQDIKTNYQETVNTDIEIWRESTAYRTALAMSSPRELARYNKEKRKLAQANRDHCQKSDAPTVAEESNTPSDENKSQENNTGDTCQSDLVDSALPSPDYRQHRLSELQKFKANCKPEELHKLKEKCELMVRECIASLLIRLSIEDFKEVEEELNRSVCWYLTCDRYWEDSHGDNRQFPWGLIILIVMVLSLGICLCYYIIWVLFDTDDISVTSASISDVSTSSPTHHVRPEAMEGHSGYPDDYYGASEKDLGQNEHYIYVTYPPDLKRRLLERCQAMWNTLFGEMTAENIVESD